MVAVTNIDDFYAEQLAAGLGGALGTASTATGTSVADPGGSFGGLTDVQAILEALATGTLGSFLTVIGGGKGTVQALGTLGATETIDLANGNLFWGTLDQNCTISTTGWTNLKDCQIVVELIQDGTGGWTPTFAGVTWIDGTPTWVTTAGTVTHVVLFSRDGGTTIYGAVLGSGGGSTPALDAVLAVGNLVGGFPIKGADSGSDVGGSLQLDDASGGGGGAALAAGDGAAGNAGGIGQLSGGDGNAGGSTGAYVRAQGGGPAAQDGKVVIRTDGSTGSLNQPIVSDGSGHAIYGEALALNNLAASVAPAVTDDSGDGYSIGSRWLDTTADKEYACLDASVGAAVWVETTSVLPAAASQAEMEAGTEAGLRQVSPLRVAQAIAANAVSVSGSSGRASCRLATTAVLSGTPTYANGSSGVGATLTEVGFGALTVDGVAVAVNDRVLVKNQADAKQNGIYVQTILGTGLVSYVLTRATDYDQSVDIFEGTFTVIEEGTANANTVWQQTTSGTITPGTSSIAFAELQGEAVSTATPAAVGTAAAGTSTTKSNDDHVHATGAGTPSTQAFGDAAAAGTGPAAAMTDHKHGMPAAPATVIASADLLYLIANYR